MIPVISGIKFDETVETVSPNLIDIQKDMGILFRKPQPLLAGNLSQMIHDKNMMIKFPEIRDMVPRMDGYKKHTVGGFDHLVKTIGL